MKGFLALARREVLERRSVFIGAAAASLIPWLIPLLRGMHGLSQREARDGSAYFLALVFTLSFAVALGLSVLSRDLFDRRIGFYFSRPLSSLTIWAGKFVGASVLILGTGLLILLPTWIAAGGTLPPPDASLPPWPLLALATLLLLPILHAASVAVRSRSAFLAADLTLLLLACLWTFFTMRRFTVWYAMEPLRISLAALASLAWLGMLAAGFASVSRGRTDIRAAHRALSFTLWPILFIAIACFDGYSRWIAAASPADLTGVETVAAAPLGSWITVAGPARGRGPESFVFLFDTSTGSYRKVGAGWRRPILSAKGDRAAWFQPTDIGAPLSLLTIKLDDPHAEPVSTKISLPGVPLAFLSPDARRIATIRGGILTVYDIASGSSLGSARVSDERAYLRGFFAEPDRFRLFRTVETGSDSKSLQLEILEFDTTARKLAKTGSIAGLRGWLALSATPSGARLLVRERRGRVLLLDGRSGALLATLAEGAEMQSGRAAFLSDGRIVLAEANEQTTRLRVFSPEGGQERTLDFSPGGRITLGGEAAPGQVVVGIGSGPITQERANRTIYLANVNIGETRRVADHLYPIAHLAGLLSYQPNVEPAAGSEAAKLFYGPGRSLIHLDPLTGERRTILGGQTKR